MAAPIEAKVSYQQHRTRTSTCTTHFSSSKGGTVAAEGRTESKEVRVDQIHGKGQLQNQIRLNTTLLPPLLHVVKYLAI